MFFSKKQDLKEEARNNKFMFDLKDTAVFMYKAAKYRYIFLREMVLEK